LKMAEAEKNHELFFMNAVNEHRLQPLMRAIFRWG
jgi:hypothetical protein